MKKQYFKLKIKLMVLITLIIVIGCTVLTYFKANELANDMWYKCREYSDFVVNLRWPEWEEPKDIVKQAYYEYNQIYLSNDSDVGFYSMLKDKKGNTLAEEQNFLIFAKGADDTDLRIILLGDDLISDDEGVQSQFEAVIPSMEITGTCDDTFIYLEELKWKWFDEQMHRYVPEVNYTIRGEKSFEDWAGTNKYDETGLGNKFYCTGKHFTKCFYKDEAEEKLDAEAKELCIQIYEELVNDIDTRDDRSKDGLFTCMVAGSGYIDDGYAIPYVFVFHPVSMAMNELTTIYIAAAFLGLFICAILCSLINKVYKQQLAYEMNRRELTRGIAHELKTPIAIVKGYVENWKYMDDAGKEECSQTMIAEMDHMNTMVMDLLELSRLEAKAKEMHIESVDIYMLTSNVLGRVKELVEKKQLAVTITPKEGEFLVNADLEMMRTVLVNFITNAVKYADSKIDITVSESAKKIKFVIANDGKSMEAEKLVRVWDEFYRGGNQSDHHMGSSGLGLAITKNILILHDAKYGCDSRDGMTEFWFEMKKSVE